jgi:hypothetical protein
MMRIQHVTEIRLHDRSSSVISFSLEQQVFEDVVDGSLRGFAPRLGQFLIGIGRRLQGGDFVAKPLQQFHAPRAIPAFGLGELEEHGRGDPMEGEGCGRAKPLVVQYKRYIHDGLPSPAIQARRSSGAEPRSAA